MGNEGIDPIDQPGFHLNKGRAANPQRMERIRELADQYRFHKQELERARDALHSEVRAAKEAGHSYNQLAEATGYAVGSVQRMVEGRWR